MNGAGAILDAVRRQKQVQRELSRRMRDLQLPRGVRESERVPFDCVFVCPTCGRFEDVDGDCVECDDGLHDLAPHNTVEVYGAELRDEMCAVDNDLQTGVVAVGLLTATVVGVLMYLAPPPWIDFSWMVATAIAVGAFALRSELAGGLQRRRNRRRTTRPVRWHRSRSATQRHPFTDEPVGGWRVVVHFDAPGDLWPWRVVVDETRLTAGATSLPEPTPLTLDAVHPDRLRRYLRERGFELSEGDYRVSLATARVIADGSPS